MRQVRAPPSLAQVCHRIRYRRRGGAAPMAQYPRKAHPSRFVPTLGEKKAMSRNRCILAAPLIVAACLAVGPVFAQTANNSISGVVTGPSGPEAGVWVIAETADLPTKFAKIVVTDDQGRYVV